MRLTLKVKLGAAFAAVVLLAAGVDGCRSGSRGLDGVSGRSVVAVESAEDGAGSAVLSSRVHTSDFDGAAVNREVNFRAGAGLLVVSQKGDGDQGVRNVAHGGDDLYRVRRTGDGRGTVGRGQTGNFLRHRIVVVVLLREGDLEVASAVAGHVDDDGEVKERLVFVFTSNGVDALAAERVPDVVAGV